MSRRWLLVVAALPALSLLLWARVDRVTWSPPAPLPPALPQPPPALFAREPHPLSETVARPLFWEYRRPIARTGSEERPLLLANGTLIALFTSGAEQVALVEVPEQGLWRITANGGAGGCRLQTATATEAQFLCGEKRVTLPLRPRPLPDKTKSNSSSPVSKAPLPPERAVTGGQGKPQ